MDKKLEYYCMEWDANKNQLYAFNIFWCIDQKDLMKKVRYAGKKPSKYNSIKSYQELREYLKGEFMYHYWSKAEHEIIVTSLFPYKDDESQKIDVWAQISPNLDLITQYVNIKLNLGFDPKGCPKDDNRFGIRKVGD